MVLLKISNFLSINTYCCSNQLWQVRKGYIKWMKITTIKKSMSLMNSKREFELEHVVFIIWLTLSDPGGGVLFAIPSSKSITNLLWMGISISIPDGFLSWRYMHCLLRSKKYIYFQNISEILILLKNFFIKIDL